MNKIDRYGRYFGYILLAFFCFTTYWSLFISPHFIDDAFITFRIARNFIAGHGPYFNPGEIIQASTTPVYLLLLTGGAWISQFPVHQVDNIYAFCLLGAIGGLLWLIGRLLPPLSNVAWLTPLIFYANIDSILRNKGMEALLYVSLILCVAIAEYYRKTLLCGALIGLIAATRTEGILMGLAYVLYWIIGRLVYDRQYYNVRQLALRTAAGIVAGLPFLFFVLYYYHSLIPESVRAKTHQRNLHFFRSIRGSWFDYLVQYANWPSVWGILLVIGGLLLLLQLRHRRAYPPFAAYRLLGAVTLFGILHAAIFFIARAPSSYNWYLLPAQVLLMPYYALIIAGLWRVAHGLLPWSDGKPVSTGTWIFGRAVFDVSLLFILYTRIKISVYVALLCATGTWNAIDDRNYAYIGKWLKAHAPATWTFATLDIGIIGYYSDLHCIDLVGIVTPRYATTFSSFSPYREVVKLQPEIYIMHDPGEVTPGSERYSAEIAAEFWEHYSMLFKEKYFINKEVHVYCRKDVIDQIPPAARHHP